MSSEVEYISSGRSIGNALGPGSCLVSRSAACDNGIIARAPQGVADLVVKVPVLQAAPCACQCPVKLQKRKIRVLVSKSISKVLILYAFRGKQRVIPFINPDACTFGKEISTIHYVAEDGMSLS